MTDDELHAKLDATSPIGPIATVKQLFDAVGLKPDDFGGQGQDSHCVCCTVSDVGSRLLTPDITCPHCGVVLVRSGNLIDLREDTEAIGESNGIEEDQKVFKAQVYNCECGKRSALAAIPIQYNANHDVYYTGGKHYLQDFQEKFPKKKMEEAITKALTNYIERKEQGENLSPWNIFTWIAYDVEHCIAEYLVNIGAKR